jgi:hypothetical protein
MLVAGWGVDPDAGGILCTEGVSGLLDTVERIQVGLNPPWRLRSGAGYV